MSFIYRYLVALGDRLVPTKFQPMWNHPAGPKTVFFWAPVIKWGLVAAAVTDVTRPGEKISVAQSFVLALTATVWMRYALVIIPKNYSLFGGNLCIAVSQSIQFAKAVDYKLNPPPPPPPPPKKKKLGLF